MVYLVLPDFALILYIWIATVTTHEHMCSLKAKQLHMVQYMYLIQTTCSKFYQLYLVDVWKQYNHTINNRLHELLAYSYHLTAWSSAWCCVLIMLTIQCAESYCIAVSGSFHEIIMSVQVTYHLRGRGLVCSSVHEVIGDLHTHDDFVEGARHCNTVALCTLDGKHDKHTTPRRTSCCQMVAIG